MARQSPHRPRHYRLATVSARHGCKAQRQTRQIGAGTIARFAALLDGADQLGHGPVKPLLKPRPHKLWPGHTCSGVQDDFLLRQIHAAGPYCALRADEIRAVLLSLASVAVKENRRLRARALNRRLGQKRRFGVLTGCVPG